MFEKIKNWYIQDFWNEKMLRKVCEKGVITEEQINEILELKISIQKQLEESKINLDNSLDENLKQDEFLEEDLELRGQDE